MILQHTLRRIRMQRLGWIDLLHDNAMPDTEDAAFRHWYGPSYGLAAKGGAVWETFAKPDWSRYINHSSLHGDGAEVPAALFSAFRERFDRADDIRSDDWLADICWNEIEAATPQSLNDYLHALRQDDEVGEPAAFEHLIPWQPTYWKQLDAGCRIRLLVRDNHPGGRMTDSAASAPTLGGIAPSDGAGAARHSTASTATDIDLNPAEIVTVLAPSTPHAV